MLFEQYAIWACDCEIKAKDLFFGGWPLILGRVIEYPGSPLDVWEDPCGSTADRKRVPRIQSTCNFDNRNFIPKAYSSNNKIPLGISKSIFVETFPNPIAE